MKLGGWIFMLISWGIIIGLFVYCMVRTLTSGNPPSGEDEEDQPGPRPEIRKDV